jgi:hypothetical protein
MMTPTIAKMLGVGSMAVIASAEYPPHLFERSPLMPSEVIVHDKCPQGQQIVQYVPFAKPKHHHKTDEHGCHHYSYWGYPYPQPC